MSAQIDYIWVDTQSKLLECCTQASQKSVVALDTEFVRIRSYYPQLGLIQLFDGNNVYLIDPQGINDFSCFKALLANTQIIKVLHACSEDLEVFLYHIQQMPTPMLDTQIMAAFLGEGASLGFAKLVELYLGITLDKGESRTDWLARPLSEKQCQYAAADVFYLLPIYHQLVEKLNQTGWQTAAQQECETLLVKRQQLSDSLKAYQDIGNAWQLTSQQLAVLRILAKWRLEEAQKRNRALNFIVKEQSLWQIAKIQPKHTATLLEFMHPNEVRAYGKKLLWLVEQSRAISEKDYPPPITRLVDDPDYKATLKGLQQQIARIIPADLPSELFASKRQLNQLFKWHKMGQDPQHLPELLQGWRRSYGEQLYQAVFGG
ncbi:ribonuclease D [Nicoletella semolina]|uniref:Ribonuclease D n=1 Tax=Nicoletella semolina TaxID=271160 RepID=A0A4R2N898_9PAST|nr:ribonuclease D [Nicoletella semolina]MDH2923870.1 ribonuclease D [Nicoletella semolina]TCP17183.1 ribonuclease D [Nicoletella semolina]